MSGWMFEKVIDSYKPGVPSTPLPNFPVSSSYNNNRNCLNIRTSLDILDNVPETRAETRVFLKSETKTDRKPAVKITLQYKLSSAFCEKGKIAGKKCLELKREIFRFAVF